MNIELSILVAKMAALVYLSAGIAALRGKLSYQKILNDFNNSPGLTYMTGFTALILGMLLVTYHNFWVKDWTVLITVIGWAAAIKGVVIIAFPDSMNWFKPAFKNTAVMSILLLALGALFGYFGFVA